MKRLSGKSGYARLFIAIGFCCIVGCGSGDASAPSSGGNGGNGGNGGGSSSIPTTPASANAISRDPGGVALNNDSGRIYFVAFGYDLFAELDSETGQVLRHETLAGGPIRSVFEPTSKRLYVALIRNDSLSVLPQDGASSSLSIPVGHNPRALALNPLTKLLYVANYGGASLSVVDTTSNTVKASGTLRGFPRHITVNPNTNLVYVSHFLENTVSVLNGDTLREVAVVPVGKNPNYLWVDLASNAIYVANSGSGSVSVIDGTSQTVRITLPVGALPAGIVGDVVGKRLFVALEGGRSVSIFDVADPFNPILTQEIPLPHLAQGIAFHAKKRILYVADYQSSQITLIPPALAPLKTIAIPTH